MNILLGLILFFIFIFAFLALAGPSTQNYCRCIREPQGDDDDFYPDLYPEYKDNVSEVKSK